MMSLEQLRILWMQARRLRRQAEFALEAAQKAHDEAERAYNEAWAAEQAVRDEQEKLVPTMLKILEPWRRA